MQKKDEMISVLFKGTEFEKSCLEQPLKVNLKIGLKKKRQRGRAEANLWIEMKF